MKKGKVIIDCLEMDVITEATIDLLIIFLVAGFGTGITSLCYFAVPEDEC